MPIYFWPYCFLIVYNNLILIFGMKVSVKFIRNKAKTEIGSIVILLIQYLTCSRFYLGDADHLRTICVKSSNTTFVRF